MNNDRLEYLYTRALWLYPAAFREIYTEPMRQSLLDALADGSIPRRRLIAIVLRDLVTSLGKEHLAMLRETYARPALIFNALVLAGISTVLALALYVIPQQVLRQGADDPQIQMADDLAARLEQGAAPGEAIPSSRVDMARSLAPFVIAFDAAGHPLASQATLDGITPAPPAEVFHYVESHGIDKITWRPRPGLRIAAVVQHVNGAQGGFVLAGRSMREVQARIEHVQNLAGLTWLAMLGLIVVGTAAFGWITRGKPVAAAV